MADSDWREILAKLDIEANATSPPAGRDGSWYQLQAVFGTRGFMRLMTDGTELVAEIAPPGESPKLADELRTAGWSVDDGDAAPLVAHRSFPRGEDELRDLWIAAARLGDAIRDDDAREFSEAVRGFTGKEAPHEEVEVSDEPSKPSKTTASSEATAGGAFEEIGGDEGPSMAPDGFDFGLDVERDWVDVLLGFGAVLDPTEYDALEKRLNSNLRGKFDIAIEAISSHEVDATLAKRPETRISLRVRPDEVVQRLRIDEVARLLEEYFGTMVTLAASGIDPLVFLGVRSSRRATGAQTAVTRDQARAAAAPDDAPSVLVADDDDDDELASREAAGTSEFVLAIEVEPEDGDPLVSGRYDDPRLRGADATTSLVDVVLRHPGYSDRSVGQVLSILLSLDYASCLDLAEKAPTVIAWGVARERAQTMKTVIEGAGGKVYLAAPGEFGAE